MARKFLGPKAGKEFSRAQEKMLLDLSKIFLETELPEKLANDIVDTDKAENVRIASAMAFERMRMGAVGERAAQVADRIWESRKDLRDSFRLPPFAGRIDIGIGSQYLEAMGTAKAKEALFELLPAASGEAGELIRKGSPIRAFETERARKELQEVLPTKLDKDRQRALYFYLRAGTQPNFPAGSPADIIKSDLDRLRVTDKKASEDLLKLLILEDINANDRDQRNLELSQSFYEEELQRALPKVVAELSRVKAYAGLREDEQKLLASRLLSPEAHSLANDPNLNNKAFLSRALFGPGTLGRHARELVNQLEPVVGDIAKRISQVDFSDIETRLNTFLEKKGYSGPALKSASFLVKAKIDTDLAQSAIRDKALDVSNKVSQELNRLEKDPNVSPEIKARVRIEFDEYNAIAKSAADNAVQRVTEEINLTNIIPLDSLKKRLGENLASPEVQIKIQTEIDKVWGALKKAHAEDEKTREGGVIELRRAYSDLLGINAKTEDHIVIARSRGLLKRLMKELRG